jgi:hypothetical protein
MTADSMNAIVRQMHDASDNRGRAEVLLRCPDNVLLKYAGAFAGACMRTSFAAGEAFVHSRVACMLAVRTQVGGLPGGLAMQCETLRAELAAYAAGADLLAGPAVVRPSTNAQEAHHEGRPAVAGSPEPAGFRRTVPPPTDP